MIYYLNISESNKLFKLPYFAESNVKFQLIFASVYLINLLTRRTLVGFRLQMTFSKYFFPYINGTTSKKINSMTFVNRTSLSRTTKINICRRALLRSYGDFAVPMFNSCLVVETTFA